MTLLFFDLHFNLAKYSNLIGGL